MNMHGVHLFIIFTSLLPISYLFESSNENYTEQQ